MSLFAPPKELGTALMVVNLSMLAKHGLNKAADKLVNSKTMSSLGDTWAAWKRQVEHDLATARVKTGKPDRQMIINDLYNRTKNIRDQIKQKADEIRKSEAFKNLSSKQRRILEQKLRRLETGNLAAAKVEIPGIKKDHISHSQINTLDDLFADLDDFTHQTNNRIFETYVEDGFPRFQDTEAKILEDIASQIKDPTIKGEIDLFSHFEVCQSCTNLILEFRRKFPNVKINIYTNSMR